MFLAAEEVLGLVIARTGDGWSAPSAIAVGGGGFGFQIGADVTDFIIVLNNQAAVDAFAKKGNFALGADISAAAGPVGRTAEGESDAHCRDVYL